MVDGYDRMIILKTATILKSAHPQNGSITPGKSLFFREDANNEDDARMVLE